MRQEVHPKDNRLLSLMSDDALNSIWHNLELTDLPLATCLSSFSDPIVDAHFLVDGVAVETNDVEEKIIKLGLLGREGMSAGRLFSDSVQSSHQTTTMILSGSSFRISSLALMGAAAECEGLRLFLLQYAQVQEIARDEADRLSYNATEEPRIASLILKCADRVDGDLIPLSQSLLGSILGAPKNFVEDAIAVLEAAHAIKATGGWIEIRDRAYLLHVAGDLYGAAEDAYERLMVGDQRDLET